MRYPPRSSGNERKLSSLVFKLVLGRGKSGWTVLGFWQVVGEVLENRDRVRVLVLEKRLVKEVIIIHSAFQHTLDAIVALLVSSPIV